VIEWPTTTLRDHITHKKGFAFKSEWFDISGRPVVKVTNFTDTSIESDEVSYVNEQIYQEYSEYKINSRDLIIQTVGSWPNNPASVVGKVVRVPLNLDGALLNQNAVLIKTAKTVDKCFLFYLLKSDFFKGYIINTAQGAANQASITLDSIFKFRFYLPKLAIQQKIAAVLSSYEDLIENNNRRIAILEKMAEEIYREWFVRMRFPGYEKVKFHKGVPEGWEYSPCSKVLKVMSGGTPKTDIESYWDGEIPFFTPKDVSDGYYVSDTEKYITEDGLNNCSSLLYEEDTIFITARGTVGKIVLCLRSMAMNQSCYALFPQKSGVEPYFYFLALRDSIKYIKGISKSGVFDNIIIDTFNAIPMLTPSNDLMKLFNAFIKPIFKNFGLLMTTNKDLFLSRNLLLSRLIAGKLSVEDLDIHFPPSMLNDEPDMKKEADA
jgi:type I restriction enzyme, S subunit